MKHLFICIICLGTIFSLAGQTETKLTASDAAGFDLFGGSVSIDGNRAIVGASGDNDNGSGSGSAYIYDWDGSNWIETKLTASDGSAYDYFGSSVSIEGNRAIVGAINDDDNGSDSGSAYVYDWDGSNWIETKLTASDGSAYDYFGSSVSIEGNRAIVGAINDDDNGSGSGSAYIYDWDGSNWIETKINASDGSAGDFFGASVIIEGNRVIVGARGDDGSGSAYIYDWDGSNWIETKIVASDGAFDDRFGSVSIDGNRAIVGANNDDDNGSNSGSAYIYDWDGSNWIETKINASDGSAGDSFGKFVSIEGNRAIVDANNDDDNGLNSGSAYIYDWDGSNWIETKLTASDGSAGDDFGSSVSIEGDRAIVGARYDDDNGSDSGSAYIYDFQPTCLDLLEPNNSITEASTSPFPELMKSDITEPFGGGNIHDDSDVDFYKVSYANDGVVEVKLTNLPDNYQLELLNENGISIDISEELGLFDEKVSHALENSGHFYIKVYGTGNSSSCDSYKLELEWTPPLIKHSWHQEWPYNEEAPKWKFNGVWKKSAAGCGAIAVSQILRYYNWPTFEYGPNGSKNYVVKKLRYPFKRPIDVDYDNSAYDFSIIDNSNTEKAKLVYQAGAAILQTYGITGTSTPGGNRDVILGLANHFAYKNASEMIRSDKLSFLNKIKEEIDNNRPVIMHAKDITNDGDHLMIIDGYDPSTNKVHINFGWGTPWNGYHDLDLVKAYNSYLQKHSKYNYKDEQRIIYNIYPNSINYVFPPAYFYETPIEINYKASSTPTCPDLLQPYEGQLNALNKIELVWEDDNDAEDYLISIKALGANVTYYDSVPSYAGNPSFFAPDLLPHNDSIEVLILPVNDNGNILSCSTQVFYTDTTQCDLVLKSVESNCLTDTTYEVTIDFTGLSNSTYKLAIQDTLGNIDSLVSINQGIHTLGMIDVGTNIGVLVEDEGDPNDCYDYDMLISPSCIDCDSIEIEVLSTSCGPNSYDLEVDLIRNSNEPMDLYTYISGVNTFNDVSQGQYIFIGIPYDEELVIVAEDTLHPYECFEVLFIGDQNNNLVGEYSFDNNAHDESSSGNDGTLNGPVPSKNRFGDVNSSLLLDGVDDVINLGDIREWHDEISFSFWVRHNHSPTDYMVFLDKHGEFNFIVQNQELILYLNGTSTPTLKTSAVPAANTWNHIAGTYDGEFMSIYLNGILVGQHLSNGIINDSNYDFFVASDETAVHRYLDGKIDDLRIYSRSLSQCEILNLYNENCGDNILIENETINYDTIINARQMVELKNVLITSPHEIFIKSPKAIISQDSEVQQGANLEVINLNGCNQN